MRKLIAVILGALGAYAVAEWWRRNRRAGTDFVNRFVDPWLVASGVIGSAGGELGLLEHVGRKSGIVRRTPAHPVPTADGFRIIAPVGEESQWARNVLAAGHCRLELGDRILELDQPVLEMPAAVPGLPRPVAIHLARLPLPPSPDVPRGGARHRSPAGRRDGSGARASPDLVGGHDARAADARAADVFVPQPAGRRAGRRHPQVGRLTRSKNAPLLHRRESLRCRPYS